MESALSVLDRFSLFTSGLACGFSTSSVLPLFLDSFERLRFGTSCSLNFSCGDCAFSFAFPLLIELARCCLFGSSPPRAGDAVADVVRLPADGRGGGLLVVAPPSLLDSEYSLDGVRPFSWNAMCGVDWLIGTCPLALLADGLSMSFAAAFSFMFLSVLVFCAEGRGVGAGLGSRASGMKKPSPSAVMSEAWEWRLLRYVVVGRVRPSLCPISLGDSARRELPLDASSGYCGRGLGESSVCGFMAGSLD